MNRESRYSEETDIGDTGKGTNTVGIVYQRIFQGNNLPYFGIKALNMTLF